MTKTVLVCHDCGATWVSAPAVSLVRQTGRCLRCDGTLVDEVEQADDTGGGDPSADQADEGDR